MVALSPFRAPPELRSLEPLNDEPQSLDRGLRLDELCPVFSHLRSQIVRQPVQRIDVKDCSKQRSCFTASWLSPEVRPNTLELSALLERAKPVRASGAEPN